jgi:drug/metabolite transporter (DMT)-like permease
MDRRRQSVFYFVAAGLFGIAFLTQAGRHGFGAKTFVAALLAMILAALGTKLRRAEIEAPRHGED